ncbi:hypothetical protein P167DRAFT_431619 [Morchella conica CCBAS932]|uniref:Uncharacterized protein n=1 Tax=Morchella conica CCBAS932 TaxID=1392247 RepID=A0A3N4KY08_9PEZI|nr:hypothetical protein P167DRAFT_431619 [Morchella conica CCBAS932]
MDSERGGGNGLLIQAGSVGYYYYYIFSSFLGGLGIARGRPSAAFLFDSRSNLGSFLFGAYSWSLACGLGKHFFFFLHLLYFF